MALSLADCSVSCLFFRPQRLFESLVFSRSSGHTVIKSVLADALSGGS